MAKSRKPQKESNASNDEIFFTMKVYATKADGDLKTLKYSIDFHPPFEANTKTIAPYASPLAKGNLRIFDRIFDNVKQLCRFIADPVNYGEYPPTSPKQYPERVRQQQALKQAIEAARGAINHVTYEYNSPPDITVGAVFKATGNGDMRPPKA